MKLSLRQRLPSPGEASGLSLLCLAGGHAWALLVFFHQLPAYLQQMRLADAMQILAYTMIYAMVESILVAIVLLLVCVAPPGWLQPGRYVAHGGLVYATIFLAFLPQQFQINLLRICGGNMARYQFLAAGWLVFCVLFLLIGSHNLRQNPGLEARLTGVVEAAGLLGWFFIIIDGLSIIAALAMVFR